MKKVVKIALALIAVGMFLAACSHYTCPAYSKSNLKKPMIDTKRS